MRSRRACERLLYFEAYVGNLADVLADAFAVAVLGRTSIVPAVRRGVLLGKALAAFVTEKLAVAAVVLVKRKFEFGAKGPFAIPARMGHTSTF